MVINKIRCYRVELPHYRIQRKLDDAARWLEGETRITLRPLHDGFETLVLDAETFRVTAVEQLRFEQTPGKLTVHLNRPYHFVGTADHRGEKDRTARR